jgi:hypothetical protein
LLLFFLPFTWGRHRRARVTTALPGATSLELLILFGEIEKETSSSYEEREREPFLLKTITRIRVAWNNLKKLLDFAAFSLQQH